MSSFRRADALDALRATVFDVVVIGAGMTGCGVALDAGSRGLSVALLDAGDIASGTSSKSSKMVHGGLRYLQHREFRLVYENLRERQRLLHNAPFLVRPLPFLLPLFGTGGLVSSTVTRAYATALRLYDLTGGWRIGQRYQRVTRAEALEHLPTLRADNLVSGFLYFDARGDDARVALALARTAALDFGAQVASYVRVTSINRDTQGGVTTVVGVDQLSGAEYTVRTKSVVNATGVWADDIFSLAEHTPSHRVTPAKGVHLSVAHDRLPADVAAILNVPGDRRSIFVVPFEDAAFTFIGTTDTAYDGSLDSPFCTPEDVAYLLAAVNASTSSDLQPRDVTGLWAGLRPLLTPPKDSELPERTSDLSRRHLVVDSGDGVVHVTGGKWTTYRKMAEDAVDALGPYLTRLARTKTVHLRLHGTGAWRPSNELEARLYRRYGDDTLTLLAMMKDEPNLADTPIEGQPYLGVEFVYAARAEMATSLVDLLTRRTRAHLHDARATLGASSAIARLVARDLGWDQVEQDRQVAEYDQLVRLEFHAAGLVL